MDTDDLGESPFMQQESTYGGDDYDNYNSTYNGGALVDYKKSGGFKNPNFILSVGLVVAVVLLLTTMSLSPQGITIGLGFLAVVILVGVELYADYQYTHGSFMAGSTFM